ncbi:unnamed protein product [Peronospora destructor]|uniref:PRA1 family protein n=1 Tax=Peronospora destructor TaxID=86335 RepID=A0AAV0TSC8_9STRA|nr:unnamed protein product [Peronospora destructor]
MKDFSDLRSREETPFNVPEKCQVLALRCRKNALHFSANLRHLCGAAGVVTILLNSFFLFVLICLGDFWLDMMADESPENPTKITGHTVTPEQRQLGMLGVSAAVIIVFRGSILFTICSARKVKGFLSDEADQIANTV